MTQKNTAKDPPIYPHTARYAIEHGEKEAYFASKNAYEDCKNAIEESINRHHDGFTFSDGLVEDVLSKCNVERVKNLLAYTVQKKEWDGRFSHSNKAWARSVQTGISEPLGAYLTVESHPALLDGFINLFRHKVLEQKKEPKAPAKKHRERDGDIEL